MYNRTGLDFQGNLAWMLELGDVDGGNQMEAEGRKELGDSISSAPLCYPLQEGHLYSVPHPLYALARQ